MEGMGSGAGPVLAPSWAGQLWASVAMGLAACAVGSTLLNALYGHLAAWEQLPREQFPSHLLPAEAYWSVGGKIRVPGPVVALGLGLPCPELVDARSSHWAADAWPGPPSLGVPGAQRGGSGGPPLVTADPFLEVSVSLPG